MNSTSGLSTCISLIKFYFLSLEVRFFCLTRFREFILANHGNPLTFFSSRPVDPSSLDSLPFSSSYLPSFSSLPWTPRSVPDLVRSGTISIIPKRSNKPSYVRVTPVITGVSPLFNQESLCFLLQNVM